ncbi:MAG: hypothetical protein WAV38_33990 [Xanthobacteraceae bacterium]
MATDNTNVINLAKYIAARVAEHEQEGKKDYEWLEERWQCALIQGRAIDGMRALGLDTPAIVRQLRVAIVFLEEDEGDR